MIKGLSYWINGKLYLSLSNRLICRSPLELKGPSFHIKGLEPLSREPNSDEIYELVNNAFENGLISVSSMESDEITFAGIGEPLQRFDVVVDAAAKIKMKRHGVPLRVKTNGLVNMRYYQEVVTKLKEAEIDLITINLAADNPKLYHEIMQPLPGYTYDNVLSFTIACIEAGLTVACSAVEVPGVNISKVRALAHSLGATNFTSHPYHP